MLTSTALDISDDIDTTYEYFERQGWGDGHPIIPPTHDRVQAFLNALDLDPNSVVAVFEPSNGKATVEKVAINAVMAGCTPDHFPVVLSAIKALAANPQHASAMGMAHSLSPLLVVSGPLASKLKIESGTGGSANSWRSNAVIARAIRLCLLNISGVVGSTDSHTFMWLPKYMYCITETLEGNPWSGFLRDKGYCDDESCVSVFWKEPAHHLEINWPASAQELLAALCDSMCTVASHASYGIGQKILLGFCPDHARMCSQAGFTKDDVKRFIFEHARKALKAYGPSAPAHFPPEWKKFYTWSSEAMVPMVARADEIELIVTGGSGANSLFFPYGYGPFIEKIVPPGRLLTSPNTPRTRTAESSPVLSPRAEDFDVLRSRDRTERPDSVLKEGTIVLIDNGRPNADVLVDALEHLIKAKGDAEVLRISKAELGLHVGDPLPAEVLQNVVSTVAGGVIAIGSCGSCTARSIRDAADFHAAGVRLAVLVAPTFERQALALSKTFKLPSELIITLPIGDVSPDAAESGTILNQAVTDRFREIERVLAARES